MSYQTVIKFGTDGWRAKIAEDFTFANVALVAQAFVKYLKDNGLDKAGIAVGFDNRFQSEHFAKCAAEIVSGAGIKTHLSQYALPSPALSYAVKSLGLSAGIMITASHNPADWNGFKIKEAFGGSAYPQTTKAVEACLSDKLAISPSSSNIAPLDIRPAYLKKISSLVDMDKIRSAKLKIVIDPMYGSGLGFFDGLDLNVVEIRNKRDPLFGGINPEPLPINLVDSMSFVKDLSLKYPKELTTCIVLDGDADRIAGIDATGQFINTHNIFTLLLRHLVVNRKLSGNIVKTFNLSNLIDILAKKLERKLKVTPIGFKYIAEQMLSSDVLLGGEESGGMGIKGFIPERDGLLAGLHLLELMAYEKQTLGQILQGIMQEHGFFYYDRSDIHTDQAMNIVNKLKQDPPKTFANKKITKVETLDGLKFNFEDQAWILFRASGTEPLLRVYAEGRSQQDVSTLLGAGNNLVSL